MNLLDILRPIDPHKKHEIERELELEKLRLKRSTENAARQFRGTVLERRWFREHPVESALLMLLGGYCLARWSDARRQSLEL